jgi:hypothetical protein
LKAKFKNQHKRLKLKELNKKRDQEVKTEPETITETEMETVNTETETITWTEKEDTNQSMSQKKDNSNNKRDNLHLMMINNNKKQEISEEIKSEDLRMKDLPLLESQSQKPNKVKSNGMTTLTVKNIIITTINKIFEKIPKNDQINLNHPTQLN